MKIKTSELLGPALDWAVARADGYDEGWLGRQLKNPNPYTRCIPEFSTDWDEGGPIIERENITIIRANNDHINNASTPRWFAERDDCVGHTVTESYEGENMSPTFMVSEGGGCYGPTPLIAAMRCFVASKLGDEVEIPDGL